MAYGQVQLLNRGNLLYSFTSLGCFIKNPLVSHPDSHTAHLVACSSASNKSFKPSFMSLVVVGSMAFDAIETPFGKSDKIIGGAGTYIAWSASNFTKPIKQISVVGGDFPQEQLDALTARGVTVGRCSDKKR